MFFHVQSFKIIQTVPLFVLLSTSNLAHFGKKKECFLNWFQKRLDQLSWYVFAL